MMFHSPTCPACVAALPVYTKVAERVAVDQPSFRMARIDVSEHPAAGDRYDIWHYPSFIIDGKEFHYAEMFDGVNQEADLYEWVMKYSSPSYKAPASNLLILNTRAEFAECAKSPVCLVQFTDSRCMECTARRNQLHLAANNIPDKARAHGLKTAMLDLQLLPEIGKEYGISMTGYVLHKVFRFGKMFHYYAMDDWNSMVEYLSARLFSPSEEITKWSEFKDKVYHSEKRSVIALLLPATMSFEKSRHYIPYLVFAEKYRDICFIFHVTESKIINRLELTSPTVLIKRQFETYTSLEEPYETIPVPDNAGAQWFEEMFNKHQFGLVNYIDGWVNIKQVQHLPHFVGVYVSDNNWGFKVMKDLKKRIAPIAKRFKGQTHFFLGDVQEVSQTFEMTDTINAAVPYLFAVNDREGRRFTPNLAQLQQMNKDKVPIDTYLTSFVEQFLAGQLRPFMKSDEDPGDLEGLIDVTALSIDRVLAKSFSEHTDLLLLLTSSESCRSCKRYEDIFMEFGEQYESKATLLMGMMNLETNEIPRSLECKAGPPNIILLPGDRKESNAPIRYFMGDIAVESLRSFMEANATHRLQKKKEEDDEEEEPKKEGEKKEKKFEEPPKEEEEKEEEEEEEEESGEGKDFSFHTEL